MALRPNDFTIRNDVTVARSEAQTEDDVPHRQRAREVAEETLKKVAPGSVEWAMTEHNIANILLISNSDSHKTTAKPSRPFRLPRPFIRETRIRSNGPSCNVELRVHGHRCQGATAASISTSRLRYTTRPRRQSQGREIRTNGRHCRTASRTKYVCSSHTENFVDLRTAFERFDAVLQVRTREVDPVNWAWTEIYIANAWSLTHKNSPEDVKKAIDYDLAAMTVLTREDFPALWARIQQRDAYLWAEAAGDKGRNLHEAIRILEAASTQIKQVAPRCWAEMQIDLAEDLSNIPTDNKGGSLHRAIRGLSKCNDGPHQTGQSDWMGRASARCREPLVSNANRRQ